MDLGCLTAVNDWKWHSFPPFWIYIFPLCSVIVSNRDADLRGKAIVDIGLNVK